MTSAEIELINNQIYLADRQKQGKSSSHILPLSVDSDVVDTNRLRTVETLSNEMVSSIIGEVTKRGSCDKLLSSDSESKQTDPVSSDKELNAARYTPMTFVLHN